MDLPEKYLVIDFETKDPYISRKYGAGWVFALNHAKDDFRLLGASVYDSSTGEVKYMTCERELRSVISGCNTWVFHNAQYDLGCILVLFKDIPGFTLEDKTIYDTLLMAKLYRQDLMVYSLENCSTRFNLQHKKQSNTLSDYGWDSGVYQQIKEQETGRKVRTRPTDSLILKTIIQNLDLIPDYVVGIYCNDDVMATNDLFKFLMPLLDCDLSIYSDLSKICIYVRRRGIRVNLDQARYVADVLRTKEENILADIKNEFNIDLNINSPYQLAEFLETIGINNYPRTPKGNPSISTDYLDSLSNEWAKVLAEARNANKIRGSFIDKIIQYQGFNNNINGSRGIMYTSLNILGATQSGRFTSGGGGYGSYELNIQQIPSSRTEIGKLCRSLFLPDEGETWIKADFSNQEPRIQVHYAVQLGCSGAKTIADEWALEPRISFHEKVAGFTNLPKPQAKTINLGLSYGMGEAKLCESLGLPTEPRVIYGGAVIRVAGPEGKSILNQYHEMLPFMSEVTAAINKFFETRGYVKTLGGRKLKINPRLDGDKRKGFSKLIQGSAADQTMIALIRCYKAGLKILNTVHDEINISSSDPDKDARTLKECMEQALPVVVPMVAEIEIGPNWAEVEEIKL